MATAIVALSEAEDERLIQDKLAELRLPHGVHFDHLELIENWLGEPTWKITFAVSKKVDLSDEFIRTVTTIQSDLRMALLDANITYRPSTRLVDSEE